MATATSPKESLTLRLDDKVVNLMDWLETKGETTYPEIGERTWRVPPVKFNVQKMHQVAAGPKVPGMVLDPPNTTDQESCHAENVVFSAFEALSNLMLKPSDGKKRLFLIANFEYDNYLNKLDLSSSLKKKHHLSDPTPNTQFSNPPSEMENLSKSEGGRHGNREDSLESPDVDRETSRLSEKGDGPRRFSDTSWLEIPEYVTKRGELDGMILHERTGILLLQIKASGFDFEKISDGTTPPKRYVESVQKAVTKAGKQLLRDRRVMLHITEDLKLLDSHMISIIALPNLTRGMFELILNACPQLKDDILEKYNLCYDNFLFAEQFHQENGVYGNLHKWWTDKLVKMAKSDGFNIDMMKQIIFRTVGLLSTVNVWTCRQPRAEVRDLNTAVVETGKRFAQMILSPRQAEILKREDQFLFIWGAAGSGKTLLLSLKGRQWQRKKYQVVILNTRLGSRGRDVGHVIEKTVNDSDDSQKALRIDFDLKDDPRCLSHQLEDLVSDNKPVKVILDEVTWMEETIPLLNFLKNLSENIVIWCAGMLEEFCPEDFTSAGLLDVLRCPPFVQRLLKIVDNREERSMHYKISSARAGLPTDGLRPFFVIHSEHCPPGRPPTLLPYDCPQCAEKVATFLKENLQLSLDSRPTSAHFNEGDRENKARSSSHGDILVTGLPQGGLSDVQPTKSRANTYPILDVSVFQKKKSKKKKNSRKGKTKGAENLPESDKPVQECQDSEETTTDKRNSCGGNEKDDCECHVTMRDTTRKKKRETNSGHGGNYWKSGSLEFSDVVLPVTMPIPWHRFNERQYYCISDEALAQNMHLMGSSVFCTTLLNAGIPVKIETGMCMDIHSEANEKVLIMCPIGKVHGLEYKVVICMPNFCALKETAYFNEGIFEAKNGPWTKRKRTPYGDEMVQNHPVFEEQEILERRSDEFLSSELHNWSMRTPTSEKHEVKIDQIRISTHVDPPPDDVLYGEESPEDSAGSQQQGTPTALTEESSCSYERQMLSDVNSPRNGRRDSDAKIAKESTSEVHLPAGVTPLEASSIAEEKASTLGPTERMDLSNVEDSLSSSQDTELPSLNQSAEFSSACSPNSSGTQNTSTEGFCVSEKAPENRDVNDFTEEELKALNHLSDWDKAYVLMSASRCTAQLIMVLP